MTKRFLILDCYVDEPACLGVPPFISPYPRYIFGALIDAGIDPDKIEYLTIDHLRRNDYYLHNKYEMVFLVGGAVVPGKYLGARIGTVAEIKKILSGNITLSFAIGGMVSRLIPSAFKNSILLKNDIEKFAHTFVLGSPEDTLRSTEEIALWSVFGSEVVKFHPHYPHIICEIETYRGCLRDVHCSFCSEGLFHKKEFRNEAEIISEIDALINHGVKRFRLGKQADILQYKSSCGSFKGGFPKPTISPLKDLFSELKRRISHGRIKTLNIDNANPGTIANFPEESVRILEIITDTITPGDTIALGIESFDPNVVRLNNLKVTPEEAFTAVKIINEIGAGRIGGIPVLLPGINLLHGLKGETMDTFKNNYLNLLKIKESGLLLKRINIRKVLPFPGTELFCNKGKISKKVLNRFEYYRDRIRQDIDNYMLKEIYPAGTILNDIMILDNYAGYSYGKEIASYSITVKFPVDLKIKKFYHSIVMGHRERSLSALPCPVNINELPQKAVELIPGISKKLASDIILQRPFKDIDQLITFTGVKEGSFLMKFKKYFT